VLASSDGMRGEEERVGLDTSQPVRRVYPDGAEEWYQNNKRHRAEGPVVTRLDGSEEWYWHGKRRSL